MVLVELHDVEGRVVRRLPDPSGGTFDASGDFDRFLQDVGVGPVMTMDLPTLRRFDPVGDSSLGSSDMDDLLADIQKCLDVARGGSETRGLLRLEVMAETCRDSVGSRLLCFGD